MTSLLKNTSVNNLASQWPGFFTKETMTIYYLTKKGLERIQKEYNQLLALKAGKVKENVPNLWHSEDVNPEYLAFQEDLSLLQARLLEYENIIKNVEIIRKPPKQKHNEVAVGATVIFEVDGQEDTFTIVGSLETNPTEGRISNESVVGQALLGAKAGDMVEVSSPVKVVYRIKRIEYRL